MAKDSALLSLVILSSLYIGLFYGHGSMVKPYTWIDTDGVVGMKPFESCHAGANLDVGIPGHGQGLSCFWFNNFTFIPGEKTLSYSMSSWPQFYDRGYFDKNPWMAPGSAPISSSCGVAGGNPNGCPGGSSQNIGEDCPGGGWSYGPSAEEYYVSPGFPGVVTTEWKAGSTVEAAWGMVANHGGGYAYRLCKVPQQGVAALTEECFQRGHLEFAGDKQWVQVDEDQEDPSVNRFEFEAVRTTVGTFPEGSQWTRNPIPNCLLVADPGPNGDYGLYDINCTHGTQFPAPVPGMWGYAQGPPPYYRPTFAFSVVDQLLVPEDLTPGEYVLSFRWDCEQTSQVWDQCANIKIVQ